MIKHDYEIECSPGRTVRWYVQPARAMSVPAWTRTSGGHKKAIVRVNMPELAFAIPHVDGVPRSLTVWRVVGHEIGSRVPIVEAWLYGIDWVCLGLPAARLIKNGSLDPITAFWHTGFTHDAEIFEMHLSSSTPAKTLECATRDYGLAYMSGWTR